VSVFVYTSVCVGLYVRDVACMSVCARVQEEEIAAAQKQMNDDAAAHESAYFQSGIYALKHVEEEAADPVQEGEVQRAREEAKRAIAALSDITVPAFEDAQLHPGAAPRQYFLYT